MNYVYMTCKNSGREAIKKQIFKDYGVQIDSDSLYKDDFAEKVKEIFEKELEDAKKKCKPASTIKEAYERLHSDKKSTEPEQVHLETAIRDLEAMISNYKNFSDDLIADVLMGLLWADENNNIDFDSNIKTEEREKEKGIPLSSIWWQGHRGSGDTRKNYPYADIVNYPNEPVPGGCLEYHKLMMNSDNVVIYDVPDNPAPGEDVQIYTYQKMDTIYQKLKDAPIENVLLLERSLGIGTSNIWYTCLKNVEDMYALEKFNKIIKLCCKIEPVFLRSQIIKIVSRYFAVVEKKIKNSHKAVENLVLAVADVILPLYEKIYGYVWSLYYLAYKAADKDGKQRLLDNLRIAVADCWRVYYTHTDSEIHPIFVKEYDQYDWRAEKSIEEYFEKLDTYFETIDANNVASNEKISWNVEVLNKFETVNIVCAGGSLVSFLARKPLPGLGEDIRAKAVKEFSFEWIDTIELSKNLTLSERDDQLRSRLYEIEKRLFDVMMKQKAEDFASNDCKLNKKKATPNNVYAYIHLQVIKNSLLDSRV